MDEPFNVAVTVAVWSETSAPVLAVNVAEVALVATLTEAGTVNRDEALLESVTMVLLVADFDRVTVQVVLALEASSFHPAWRFSSSISTSPSPLSQTRTRPTCRWPLPKAASPFRSVPPSSQTRLASTSRGQTPRPQRFARILICRSNS